MPVRKNKARKSKPSQKSTVAPPVDPKYYGEWVAWTPGGPEVIASGDSTPEVDRQVIELGYNVREVPFEWIEPPPRYIIVETEAG